MRWFAKTSRSAPSEENGHPASTCCHRWESRLRCITHVLHPDVFDAGPAESQNLDERAALSHTGGFFTHSRVMNSQRPEEF